MVCTDGYHQRRYLSALRKDVIDFKLLYNNSFELKGFDIGGGTPTSLSESNFNYLMDIYDEAVSEYSGSNSPTRESRERPVKRA